MRYLMTLGYILWSSHVFAADERPPDLAPVPSPPELPEPVESGEPLKPEITIIRKGKQTIQEYRINGQLYMVKIIPDIGPPYYLVDTDGDGNMDVRRSDLMDDIRVPQWVIFSW